MCTGSEMVAMAHPFQMVSKTSFYDRHVRKLEEVQEKVKLENVCMVKVKLEMCPFAWWHVRT